MLIRDATDDDLGAIRDIYNDAVLSTTAIWNDVPVDLTNRQVWAEGRRAQGYPVLVAELDGIAGYASFGDWRAFDGFRLTVEHSVYVDRAHHGKGVGRALMVELIGRARGCGKHVMVAAIEAENVASIRLHQSLGFQDKGTLRQVGVKFGRWLDLSFLELRLDDRSAP